MALKVAQHGFAGVVAQQAADDVYAKPGEFIPVMPANARGLSTAIELADTASAGVCTAYGKDSQSIQVTKGGRCALKVTVQLPTVSQVCGGAGGRYVPPGGGTPTSPTCSNVTGYTAVTATTTFSVWDPRPVTSVFVSLASEVLDVSLSYAPPNPAQPGAIYVVFILNGAVFFLDSTGAWVLWLGGAPPAYQNSLAPLNQVKLIGGVNPGFLKGGVLLVGYGRGVAPLSDPFAHMLTQATYDVIHTVR